MSRQGGGNFSDLLREPPPVKTISFDLAQFSFRLFSSAQVLTFISSLVLVSELTAGTMTSVSSANLTSALPVCTGWWSDAVTMNDAGPTADGVSNHIILAKMFASSEMLPLNFGAVRNTAEKVDHPVIDGIRWRQAGHLFHTG